MKNSPSIATGAAVGGRAWTSGTVLGLLLIAEALLAFAPVAILGPAIGWPASLSRPAAEQLAAIVARPDALALGYGLYLLYSILLMPAMFGLAARTFDGLGRPVSATVAGFCALSTLSRSIGISRWLTVMPMLAVGHGAPNPALRVEVEWLFDAINAFGGGIGELLGVSIFMAASLGTWAVGARAADAAPRWLSGLALLCALALAGLALPAFGGPQLVPVAGAVSLLSLWLTATGVWLIGSK